ncbi:hypothetical protein GCM10023318_23950 [Nocardia callitridis]|uniref:Uncharacterized protein n=1 Tax=Nocardia callitridis TaxID=648753 RepID=A0ABP9K5T3_9NOCA
MDRLSCEGRVGMVFATMPTWSINHSKLYIVNLFGAGTRRGRMPMSVDRVGSLAVERAACECFSKCRFGVWAGGEHVLTVSPNVEISVSARVSERAAHWFGVWQRRFRTVSRISVSIPKLMFG